MRKPRQSKTMQTGFLKKKVFTIVSLLLKKTSTKGYMSGVIPYLIRAYCEWIEDSNLTPYLLVNTKSKGVVVPEGYDANGKMVLNISSSATMNREIRNEAVSLKA